MRFKKVVFIIGMAFVTFMCYQFYHGQKDKEVRKDDNLVTLKRITKSKGSLKGNVTKEARDTLEQSDESVSKKKTEVVREALKIPIAYLESVENQSDIKVTYDNKLSITNQTVAQTLKTMLLAGYEFKLASLKVYESDSDNVYQFTLLLVTDKGDKLSLTGNYVLGTEQFEFVSLHGTPVNVVF